jgi:disulfide bond formation protein DsbB
MRSLLTSKLVIISNFIDVLGILVISIMAVIFQLVLHELPCPLCLMQRIGLMAIGFGYLVNIVYGNSIKNYSYATICAMLTAFIAMRQILLHIVPGTGGYGDVILGFHMYTWVFIICMAAIIWNMFIIMIYPEDFSHEKLVRNIKIERNIVVNIVVYIYIITILINVVFTFLECGTTACPDDPTTYLVLDFIKHIHSGNIA